MVVGSMGRKLEVMELSTKLMNIEIVWGGEEMGDADNGKVYWADYYMEKRELTMWTKKVCRSLLTTQPCLPHPNQSFWQVSSSASQILQPLAGHAWAHARSSADHSRNRLGWARGHHAAGPGGHGGGEQH